MAWQKQVKYGSVYMCYLPVRSTAIANRLDDFVVGILGVGEVVLAMAHIMLTPKSRDVIRTRNKSTIPDHHNLFGTMGLRYAHCFDLAGCLVVKKRKHNHN